jgi:hypothetical protein
MIAQDIVYNSGAKPKISMNFSAMRAMRDYFLHKNAISETNFKMSAQEEFRGGNQTYHRRRAIGMKSTGS